MAAGPFAQQQVVEDLRGRAATGAVADVQRQQVFLARVTPAGTRGARPADQTVGALGLGLRQGEACAITIDRVDFLRRRVTIDRQVVTARRAIDHALGPVNTPASNRTIPLPETVAVLISEHIATFTPHGPRGRLLFTTSDGTMLGRQTYFAAFNGAVKRLGIEASSQDLRHHAASRLIAAGCSPRAVAAFLGHKNATETLNTYAHLWPTDEGRIVAAIDTWLNPRTEQDVHEMCTGDATEVG
ncbi:MAG TPA: site-specific integrase [Ilumatobacter sp.]